MKDHDVGNESIATDSAPSSARPAINRRDLLVGTAGVVALTSAIAAQTSWAAQAPGLARTRAARRRPRGNRPGGHSDVQHRDHQTEGRQAGLQQHDHRSRPRGREESLRGAGFHLDRNAAPPLTWRETQDLIKVVAEAGCIPFVRVPSANWAIYRKPRMPARWESSFPWSRPSRRPATPSCSPNGRSEIATIPNAKPWGHRSSGAARPALSGARLPVECQQQHSHHDPDRESSGSRYDR